MMMRSLPKKTFFYVVILLVLLPLMSSCANAFRKRATEPAPPPRGSSPSEPAPPSVQIPPSQPQPLPEQVPPVPVSPPAKPEAPVQPEAKKPVLPSDSAAAQLLSQGWDYLRKGNLDLAEMKFEKALRISPSTGTAYYGLADISFLRGQLAQCIEFAQSAELYAFNDTALLLKLSVLEGDCYLKMGKREDAAKAYRRGLDIAPDDATLIERLKKASREGRR